MLQIFMLAEGKGMEKAEREKQLVFSNWHLEREGEREMEGRVQNLIGFFQTYQVLRRKGNRQPHFFLKIISYFWPLQQHLILTCFMNELSFENVELDDLDNCAAQLMDFAGDGRIFLFYGEMGAGKTTFIHALCTYLGVNGETGSPTFALVNEYEGSTAAIYHFDMYRIEDEREALDIGMEEYLDSGNYCFIEWPERILGLLPLHYIRLKIIENEGKRSISAEKV